MVHLNNVEAMKYVRRSKSPVEVENIKQILAKGAEAKKNPTIAGTGIACMFRFKKISFFQYITTIITLKTEHKQ